MTRTPSITDTYRSLTGRLDTTLGVLVAYLTTGVMQGALAQGASLEAFAHALSSPLLVWTWPVWLFDPVYWTFSAVGLVVGLGTLAALERTRLPIAAPRRLPTPTVRHSTEGVAALLLAEVVARYTTAAALVAYFHIWPPHRGEPDLSLAFYQEAVAFMTAFPDMPYLTWIGHLLPDIGAVPSGGPDANHVLRGIGEIQFFDGIGFALVVGYAVALGLSYGVVRVVSRRVREN